MPSLLVTGSNRGIGLEFVRQYAAEGWRVHAACRRPEAARELAAVEGDVAIHRLDVADDRQIAALAEGLADEALDILVNNAGVGGPREGFGETDTATWLDVFRVNSIAPLHMAERFIEHLMRGRRKLIVGLTSRMGSIADNTGGGYYIYRSSKAALNAAMKSLAIDLAPRGVAVVVFHPGWVKTDMGGPGAQIAPRASVAGMRRKIESLGPADSGRFFNYDGGAIPW